MTERSGPATTRRDTQTLSAHDVSVTYGPHPVLHHITLRFEPAQFVAVTGPSGTGKTSLLWVLAGALSPASGTVYYGDRRISDRHAAATAGIAIIPQGNALASTLTAIENAQAPLLAAHVPPDEAAARVDQALAAVGLDESGNHLIEELSGGQQQRAAIARTLATHANIILADEPTSELDATTREHILTLLHGETQSGATVIMTTNDPDAAAQANAELTLDEGTATWVRHPALPQQAIPGRGHPNA